MPEAERTVDDRGGTEPSHPSPAGFAYLRDMAEPEPTPAVTPTEPRDVGVSSRELRTEEIEPARMLANDVREGLLAAGFSEEEVVDWARAYVVEVGEGTTADELISWIRNREQPRG